MLGAHHAGTGAAVWVALTAVNPIIPATGLAPMEPTAVAIGGIVAAGAALLPDADHPSATIAYSIPGVGKAATSLVGGVSGGHRHGTHSGLSAVVVVALAAWLTGFSGLVDTSYLSTYVVVSAVIAVALITFAVKVLRIARSWGVSWLIGLIGSALITFLIPHQWAWLPWAIAVGWVVHMAGDFLTTGGLPLLWPAKVSPPKWWSGPILDAIWSKGGYFALPILGNTGSWREMALATPLTLYAIYGIIVSALATLPFLPWR